MSYKGREFVIDFWKKKYGQDKVCKIGTYGRLKIKSAIKAIAQSKGYGILDNDGKIVSYEPNVLTKILDIHVTATSRGQDELDEMLQDERFAAFFDKHEKWFIDYVMPILESVSAQSIHAAGVVITDEPYEQVMPLNYRDKDEGITTQYEMDAVDLAGYLKYDMLVLTAVTLIEDVKRLIRENHGVDIPTIEEIDLEDPMLIELFNKVMTRGIFQFNTRSQMRFLSLLKVRAFRHLVAAIALIRPGPISAGMPETYAARMNGQEKVSYPFESTSDILSSTYGLMVYQEQMMQLAMKIASFSGVEAESLRKACGKKKIEEMKKWEAVFVDRARANGHDPDDIATLWEEIVGSASYSFNKSHSAVYTMISAYQAWIKARYPTEYWTATLLNAKKSTKSGNSVYDLKAEAEREGMKFIFPSAEGFAAEFSVASEGRIYWPLNVIKGVGEKALEVLSDMGNRNHFESMQHFVDVATSKHPSTNRVTVTAAVVKPLVKAGFFNCWMKPWEAMREYNRLVSIAKKEKEKDIDYEMAREDEIYWQTLRNQSYGCQVEKWKDIAAFSPEVRGYYPDELVNLRDGCKVLIGGEVKDIFIKKDKNGKSFADMRIVDGAEFYFVRAWNDWWGDVDLDKQRTRPRAGDIIELVVRKSMYNGYAQLAIGEKGQYCRIVARPSKTEK